jgi:hypothetical protein
VPPTAKQSVGVTHDTASRLFCPVAAGLGLGTIDHDGEAPAGDANPTAEPDTSTIAATAETNRHFARRPLRTIPPVADRRFTHYNTTAAPSAVEDLIADTDARRRRSPRSGTRTRAVLDPAGTRTIVAATPSAPLEVSA